MSFGPPPSIFTQSTRAAEDARARRRRHVLAVVAAVLVVVLGVGGGLLWYRSDHAPNTTPRVARQGPDEIRETVEKVPRTPEGTAVIDYSELVSAKNKSGVYAPGTWVTDKIFAKGIGSTVKGIKIGVGGLQEKAWTLKLSGHICATSPDVTVDGRTAVVVQPAQHKGAEGEGICDEIVFLDLDHGKVLWRRQLPGADQAYVTNTNLTMTRNTVAVAWRAGSVGYDMKAGKQLWKSTGVDACQDVGFAGGRALLALIRCGTEESPEYKVQKVDPHSGRPVWTYKVAQGIAQVYLPSSDPPVLAVAAGDSEVTDLITLDDRGRHLATISLEGDLYDAMCGRHYGAIGYFRTIESCDGVVVGRTEVFVVSTKENWIMGFDRKTGKTRRKLDGRDSMQPIQPLRMSGDQLLVYSPTGDGIGPAAVLLWDPRTGKERPFLLFSLPDDSRYELSDPDDSDIIVEGGRVFFAKRQLSPDEDHPDVAVTVAIGVGSVE
ncbi:PQQ-binding-like beta-propeller repeat protein [Streptomyces sp. NPDC052051]|uniref:outer membrane protein assembly factor BamB family protein n=1 Tax=Streptomyces sp. NPDC052051 TaxID=3154649 RepID=UPI0034334509